MKVDAKLRTLSCTLEYDFSQANGWDGTSWPGDLRDMQGSYRFREVANRTSAPRSGRARPARFPTK